ncbi:MAG: hypothetical protein JNM39_06405 [Bdellovibrionaceae bacterium]|nr:hypothetical protein [Pseudobdellovibrionaceae bacterium]
MEIVERAKTLLSHALPNATLAEVIVRPAERYVRTRVDGTGTGTKARANQSSTSATEETERQRRVVLPQSIPAAVKGNEPFNLRPIYSSHNKFSYTNGC